MTAARSRSGTSSRRRRPRRPSPGAGRRSVDRPVVWPRSRCLLPSACPNPGHVILRASGVSGRTGPDRSDRGRAGRTARRTSATLDRVDHHDHVRLLRAGVEGAGPKWADLGSGEGAFTLALADLLGSGGSIRSVDRDTRALQVQARAVAAAFPSVTVTSIVADFSKPLGLLSLDGIVLANSLHFQRDQAAVLKLVIGYLRPGGRLILVEYDSDRGNQWVPFPLSFDTWSALAAEAGLRETQRLASVPSRFLGSIYSALSLR